VKDEIQNQHNLLVGRGTNINTNNITFDGTKQWLIYALLFLRART
jgi:hypothetical protein